MDLSNFEKLSPMMKQYVKIKKEHKNHLLFFRLGDFYELFFDDAVVASKELEITLTGKECGLKQRAPMCGIPFHSAGTYIKKLIDKGFKVAICEQVEKISSTKNLVKREVVRIITPGTVFESDFLQSGLNNYICSIFLQKTNFSICFCDVSTGVLHLTKIESNALDLTFNLINELERFLPVEVLYNEEIVDLNEISNYLTQKLKCVGCLIKTENFDEHFCFKMVKNQFDDVPVEVLNSDLCLKCLTMLLYYLNETQKRGIVQLNELDYYDRERYLGLDYCVCKNLELTQTLIEGKKQKSLLWVMDRTKTAMGKRLIRKIIEQPLIDLNEIIRRQNAVEAFNKNLIIRDEAIELLSQIFDLERLMTKLVYDSINPRELKSFSYALSKLPILKQKLSLISNEFLNSLNEKVLNFNEVCDLIDCAIVEEPPVNFKDGGVIAAGFDAKLDELRKMSEFSKELLLKIEEKERTKTGISKLKIKYNRVFGYFLEVSKAFVDKVPKNYIRKQTVSGAERFITNELKDLEFKILQASENSIKIEQEIFELIKKRLVAHLSRVQITAKAVALIDVLCSFSVVSVENKYVKPEMNNKNKIEIKNGRHPVVELITPDYFVGNDTFLDCEENKMMLITGPNMAGKSTYMRQVVLIVIMAQMGCFVPADCAKIGVVDRIFTRVGAYDDLTSGRSTFMVEMSEVAKILKGATCKSLIVFDEVGRGTSTFDGMSIAKSVAEYILNHKNLQCKTLFATHYHELTVLEKEVFGVKNYSVAVKNYGDKVSFLRKIVKGSSNDSYGIVVAALAGLPQEVIDRANLILKELETGRLNLNYDKKIKTRVDFEISDVEKTVLEKIKCTSLDALTPIEAFNLLYALQSSLKKLG